MMDITFDWNEVSTLVSILNSKGVNYLIGEGAALSEEDANVDAVRLIQRLAGCNDPLVENACISLFILHPELAPAVMEALQSSGGEVAENIAVVTLATLYLQQWWLFRLTCALGRIPSFPEAPFVSLWEERHLPAPDVSYGIEGLLALEEYQERRYDLPLNYRSDWQNQIDHLLTQEEAYNRELSNEVKDTLTQIGL